MSNPRAQGRYTAYDTSGTAGYHNPNAEPPAWMVEVVPGAAEARQKWQDENERGKALSREWRASSRALVEYRALRPTSAELETAQRAHDEKTRAVERQSRVALRALREFDDLVLDAREAGSVTGSAADVALEAHREAVEAFEKGLAALKRRDSAWRGAGAPGVHWENYLPNPLDRLPLVERILGVALERFPVAAVEEVSASGASTAPRLATVVLPDGRTITANPHGPFGKPTVTMPGEKVPA